MKCTATKQNTENRPNRVSALSACACACKNDEKTTDAAVAVSVFAYFLAVCRSYTLRVCGRFSYAAYGFAERLYRIRFYLSYPALAKGVTLEPCQYRT